MGIIKKQLKTIKIAAATTMAIFSLASVFTATYAWFAMNKEATASGMNIEIARMNGRLKYVYFHAFNENASNDNTFKFNKTPFATYEYDWDDHEINIIDDEYATWGLGDYSYTSKNHCMLALFVFDKDYTSSTAGDIYVKGITTVGGDNLVTTYNDGGQPVSTTGGGFLGARTSTGAPYYTLPQTQVNDSTHTDSILMKREPMLNDQGVQQTDNQGNLKYYDYYALSSVANFRYQTFDNNSYSSFLSANSGTTLDFATSGLQTGGAFTTINNDTDKYIFDQTPYLYKSDGHSTVKYIALIINYSPEAIGYIYSTYLGDSGLNKYDSLLYFACDWRFEVF